MGFLTNDKLVIAGAGGMIGSNMLQTAIMMKLTPNICAYDVYEPALEGAVEEMWQSGFEDINLSFTTDPEKAFKDAKYVISSGGAPRKGDMTREDLLKENSKIARQLGEYIKAYCPDVKMVNVVFNPSDITGLVTLIYAGIAPSKICTLAALDSTRLRIALAQKLNLPPDEIKIPRTYGGHGEMMAVFATKTTVSGTPLKDLIGTDKLSKDEWDEIKKKVTGGGKRIIDLRGRSSFQSPSYLSVAMIRAAMGGKTFDYPVGVYVDTPDFNHIMMFAETTLNTEGVSYTIPTGSLQEMQDLETSYNHLRKLRDVVIALGLIPSVDKWANLNPNLESKY